MKIDRIVLRIAIIGSYLAFLYLAIFEATKWSDYKWGERLLKDGQYGHWWIVVAGVFVATFLIATAVAIALCRWLYGVKRSFASEAALMDLCLYVALLVLGEGLSVGFYSKALASIGLGFLVLALDWIGTLWFAIGIGRYFRGEGFGNAGGALGEDVNSVQSVNTEAKIRNIG